MRFQLSLPRLPLLIFIVIILVSCLVGYGIIYSALATYSRGDYFYLENEYVQIEFPRNWLTYAYEQKNETGSIYTIFSGSVDSRVVIILMVFDRNTTEYYMNENNLNDTFSVIIFEARRAYLHMLKRNENATLFFLKNDTMNVSGYKADYTIIKINDGLIIDETVYDWKGMIVSWMNKEHKIFQIVFYGEEGDWKKFQDSFEHFLNSTKLKE